MGGARLEKGLCFGIEAGRGPLPTKTLKQQHVFITNFISLSRYILKLNYPVF